MVVGFQVLLQRLTLRNVLDSCTIHNRCVKFTLTAGDEKATVGANYNKKRALEAKEDSPALARYPKLHKQSL